MLFEDIEFKSRFDFGESTEGHEDITVLAKELSDIYPRIYKNHPLPKLKHDTYMDSEILISQNENPQISNRSVNEIKQILYRPEGALQSSISKLLSKIGLPIPQKNDILFDKTYLQILYFFYLTNYVVFPKEDFLNSPTEFTSSNSPLNKSKNGIYWHFIIENALDNQSAKIDHIKLDMVISIRISNITSRIDHLISESFDEEQNISTSKRILEKVESICNSICIPQHSNNLDYIGQLLDAGYRFEIFSYANDMVSNLDPKARPFDFPELEYELNPKLHNNKIAIQNVDKVMSIPDVLLFCNQSDSNKPISKSAQQFLLSVIEYDKNILKENNNSFFVKWIDSTYCISEADIALIIKTFYDIKATNQDFFMRYISGDIYSKGRKWRNSQKLFSVLSKKTSSQTICDLAMRLFILACHSEIKNITLGHGYYVPVFQNIYLNRYLLVQKIVKRVFSFQYRDQWCFLLKQIESELTQL